MSGNQFQVHFSEEDLFHIEGDYCRMYANVVPAPVCGNFLIRPQGLYEVATVNLGFDGNWDIYLRQIVAELEEGDLIQVYNNDRLYRCEKVNPESPGNLLGFKKVTMSTLLHMLTAMEKRMQVKMSDLAEHVHELIR